MTDLAAVVQDARDALLEALPPLAEMLRDCHVVLYADHRRRTPHILPADDDDPPERQVRCGACEHRAEDHEDRGCARCRCRRLEPYPATVGWAQWTGPGRAEVAYVAATKHIQRANNAIGQVERVPAHWASAVLEHPGERSAPIPLRSALHGVALLHAALSHVDPASVAPPEANAVLECRDEIDAARKALESAEDKLTDREKRDLAKPRCVEPDCRIVVHAEGRCQSHYDRRRKKAS